jgi:hypothetical protein
MLINKNMSESEHYLVRLFRFKAFSLCNCLYFNYFLPFCLILKHIIIGFWDELDFIAIDFYLPLRYITEIRCTFIA